MQIKLFPLWTLVISLSDYIGRKYEMMKVQCALYPEERLNGSS